MRGGRQAGMVRQRASEQGWVSRHQSIRQLRCIYIYPITFVLANPLAGCSIQFVIRTMPLSQHCAGTLLQACTTTNSFGRLNFEDEGWGAWGAHNDRD